MSDLDILRDLVPQLPPPEFDRLVAVARKRRRRAVMATATGIAVVVLSVGMASASLTRDQSAPPPAQNPSPSQTESPSVDETWTPERIVADGRRGDPQGEVGPTESGLATRMYVVCSGADCSPDDVDPTDRHVALEVIQGGQHAVFDLQWSRQPWVRVYDDDSVLVQDSAGFGEPVRYRLLQADGTGVELRLLDDPAPAASRPGMVVIDDYDGWVGGMGGVEDVFVVDDRAGTIQQVGAPDAVRYWGPKPHEFLWGAGTDCRAFWEADGRLEEHRLDCSDGFGGTYGPTADEYPPGWLRPGRMAVGEWNGTPPREHFVHVSLDRGNTWRRLPVPRGETVTDVLARIG